MATAPIPDMCAQQREYIHQMRLALEYSDDAGLTRRQIVPELITAAQLEVTAAQLYTRQTREVNKDTLNAIQVLLSCDVRKFASIIVVAKKNEYDDRARVLEASPDVRARIQNVRDVLIAQQAENPQTVYQFAIQYVTAVLCLIDSAQK